MSHPYVYKVDWCAPGWHRYWAQCHDGTQYVNTEIQLELQEPIDVFSIMRALKQSELIRAHVKASQLDWDSDDDERAIYVSAKRTRIPLFRLEWVRHD